MKQTTEKVPCLAYYPRKKKWQWLRDDFFPIFPFRCVSSALLITHAGLTGKICLMVMVSSFVSSKIGRIHTHTHTCQQKHKADKHKHEANTRTHTQCNSKHEVDKQMQERTYSTIWNIMLTSKHKNALTVQFAARFPLNMNALNPSVEAFSQFCVCL